MTVSSQCQGTIDDFVNYVRRNGISNPEKYDYVTEHFDNTQFEAARRVGRRRRAFRSMLESYIPNTGFFCSTKSKNTECGVWWM